MEDEGERPVDVGFGGRVEMAAVVMVVIVVVVVMDGSWGSPAAGRHWSERASKQAREGGMEGASCVSREAGGF